MPTTEEQIKKIIAKHQGKASRREIARELKISLSYTDLVCQGLLKKGEIKPLEGGFCLLSNLQKKKAKPFPPKQQKSWSKYAPIVKLMRKTNIGLDRAARLINQARSVLSKKKTN